MAPAQLENSYVKMAPLQVDNNYINMASVRETVLPTWPRNYLYWIRAPRATIFHGLKDPFYRTGIQNEILQTKLSVRIPRSLIYQIPSITNHAIRDLTQALLITNYLIWTACRDHHVPSKFLLSFFLNHTDRAFLTKTFFGSLS